MKPSPAFRVVDVNVENFDSLPCCGIKDPAHPGRQAKESWFREQAGVGLRAKALLAPDGKNIGYIEYIPGEYAWRGVNAAGYMFIHCIWVHSSQYGHQGGGRKLLQACLSDARKFKMHGVAVLARQGPWIADSRIFLASGFKLADSAPPDYQLLVRRFDTFAPSPTIQKPDGQLAAAGKGLTIVQSIQCPYAVKFGNEIADCARNEYGLKPRVIISASAQDAQHAPTPYAVFAILYDGRILADHQISRTRFRNIMKMVSIPVTRPSKNKKAEA